MITADQLVAHAIGDYLLQSDWMATKKRTETLAAVVHASIYTLCFLPFALANVHPGRALAVIYLTHVLIDRHGLARYVVWAKNWLAPRWLDEAAFAKAPDGIGVIKFSTGAVARNYAWRECQATGYPPDRPPFLAVWLLIVADNVIHVVINALALRYL